MLSNGPWHVEEQLLLLSPWVDSQGGEGVNFSKAEFWVQITGLPEGWYSSRIGKKLFTYLKDCATVDLQ